jgi:polyisoprenoid-binding protein YceI
MLNTRVGFGLLVVLAPAAWAGVHVPVPEAANVVLKCALPDPAQIAYIQTTDLSGAPCEGEAKLSTLGQVALGDETVIPANAPTLLLVGNTIVQGAFRNTGQDWLKVGFSGGLEFTLAPAEGGYVGPILEGPPKTHGWQCVCTCSTGGASATVTYDCGPICSAEGDQCRSADGSECWFHPDGPGVEGWIEGTLSECYERLVPHVEPCASLRYRVSPQDSSILVRCVHQGISPLFGRFEDVRGGFYFFPRCGFVMISAAADSLRTGDPERDRLLAGPDFLNASEHPRIEYRARRVVPGADGTFHVHGDLTIAGVRRPVTVRAEMTGEGATADGEYRAGVYAVLPISRKEFGLAKSLDVFGDEVEIIVALHGVLVRD